MFTGKARIDSTRSYPWTGSIKGIYYIDLDSDQKKELVVYPREGYAQSPRGIIVYDGQTFEEKWRYLTGPYSSGKILMGDFNKNGNMEFLIPTSSSCNGNIANDTDDFHSYFYYVEYLKEEAHQIENFGGANSTIMAKICYNDVKDTHELYILSYSRQTSDQNLKIEVFTFNLQDNIFSRTEKDWSSTAQEGDWIWTTDDSNNVVLIVLADSGEIFLLNRELNEIKKRNLLTTQFSLGSCEDLNGDQKDEIFLDSDNGGFLIDDNLDIIAKVPKGYFRGYAVPMVKPMLIFHRKYKNSLIALYNLEGGYLFALEKNSFYLISFYGKPVFFLFLITMLFVFVRDYIINKQKNKFFQRIIHNSFEAYHDAQLLMDSTTAVHFANKSAKKLLHIEDISIPVSLSGLKSRDSEIIREICSLIDKPYERSEKIVEEENGSSFHVSAELIFQRGAKRPNWFVKIENLENKNALEQAKSWSAMAQRVSHNIKNPLTSIQLSTQRLQREYQKLESENAKNYDPYVNRIIKRIEVLKKLSRDFMKFINVEKANKQLTDFNEFIGRLFSDSRIEIPKDITLNVNLTKKLPTFHVDQEQLQALIENLVSNAINAMPEGGVLTVTTNLASNLPLKKNPLQDYLVLEIMDTGIGIPKEMKDKLFQTFITNSYLGTGLGLAIVKKIVEDHDGHIEVNSEEGVGTSFMIYFPVA